MTSPDPKFTDALHRCIDEYHWNFPFVRRFLNMRFGTDYDKKELWALYHQSGKAPPEVFAPRPRYLTEPDRRSPILKHNNRPDAAASGRPKGR